MMPCNWLVGGVAFALPWPFVKKKTLDQECQELMKSSMHSIIQGDYVKADVSLHCILKLLSDAVLSEKLTVVEHAGKRARVFSEMANLKLMQRDFVSAESLFVQTIRDCIQAGTAEADPMIIELSLKLALVYAKLGDDVKAKSGFNYCVEKQLQNCSQIVEKGPLSEEEQNHHALLGTVYNAYSHYLIERNDLTTGQDLLERALKVALLVYGPYHANCINIMSDLATVLSRLEKFDAARQYLREAVNLSQNAAANDPTLNIVIVNLFAQWAVLEGNQGHSDKAQLYLKEARLWFEKLCPTKAEKHEIENRLLQVDRMLNKWQKLESEDVEEATFNN